MAWQIKILKSAGKEFNLLPVNIKERMRSYLRKRVQPEPTSLGENLSGQYKGLRRYRVGDYRIICYLDSNEKIITIMKIGHRKEVYRNIN